MKARRKQSGISLLELVIALAVIAIAMFGILSMILHNMATKETMRELQIAKEAVTTKMEEIKSHPMMLPGTDVAGGISVWEFYANTKGNNVFDVQSLQDPTTPSKLAQGTIVIDKTNPYLYEVMVTVKWAGRKGPTELSRRSMIAQ
jgi:Tfp pilus assembly protein PilV